MVLQLPKMIERFQPVGTSTVLRAAYVFASSFFEIQLRFAL